MKKEAKIFLTVSAVLLAAAGVQKETERRQRKARKEGRHVPCGPYEAVLKRPFDMLTAGMALVPLAPVMGITAFLIKTRLGSPVIFRQKRPGKDEKIFTLCKFRTMTDERDENGALLPDEKRLTGFGKWLRSTSLDELPELFHILRGEMSLVGPRPLLVEYLPEYNERQRKRHDVRPGLTGLAQVSGRNSLSWDERFEDDLEYIRKITFLGDVKILLATLAVVFKRRGISSDTSATMELFTGSEKKDE